jgi:hypothetical protein
MTCPQLLFGRERLDEVVLGLGEQCGGMERRSRLTPAMVLSARADVESAPVAWPGERPRPWVFSASRFPPLKQRPCWSAVRTARVAGEVPTGEEGRCGSYPSPASEPPQYSAGVSRPMLAALSGQSDDCPGGAAGSDRDD